ncbi:hypothetical protein [Pseudomonas sp. GL-B-16]|uniref:hypothetical protein n=1 Tax=Pseudomonas sp. GL-B-16 TaxID=2832373 RepID=UPI001CBE0DB2|nr:hypothetical protein [Pseudomonas sp. GL-B-16]
MITRQRIFLGTCEALELDRLLAKALVMKIGHGIDETPPPLRKPIQILRGGIVFP